MKRPDDLGIDTNPQASGHDFARTSHDLPHVFYVLV
jgi:hypothetical protein